MFNFRIITTADGTEVIDRTLKTPYSALTPSALLEYTETEKMLYFFSKEKRKKRKEESRKETKIHSILASLQTACGIL